MLWRGPARRRFSGRKRGHRSARLARRTLSRPRHRAAQRRGGNLCRESCDLAGRGRSAGGPSDRRRRSARPARTIAELPERRIRMNLLDTIVANKRAEIAALKVARPGATDSASRTPRDLEGALRAPGLSVIAEIKRRSPSRGSIRENLDPAGIARIYEAAGAA